MNVKLVPVVRDGLVLLFDIYINGEWHGSRRTARQCRRYCDHYEGSE